MRYHALALALAVGSPAAANAQSAREIQQRIRESQQTLQEIREERRGLQDQLERMQARAYSLSEELQNLERQRQTTGRLVNELDRQLSGLGAQVDQVTQDLVLAENALAEKEAVSRRRLVDIYKRGPLHSVQVLLAAESFGDLLSRYKYLFLISRQDRQLAHQLQDLRNRVAASRSDIVQIQRQIGRRRDERTDELRRYLTLQQQRQRSLSQARRQVQSTQTQLASLSDEERRIANLLASLEAERAAAEARAGGARAGSISDADLGRLDWPVTGSLAYRFGPTAASGGGRIRWDGIGIRATPGTEVVAVRGGRVVSAEPLGTYRTTVILDHGGGYYTLYAFLRDAAVVKGQEVTTGQAIGRVGEAADDQGARLHFEIRGPGSLPLDPLTWLRRR